MPKPTHFHPRDVHGVARLAADATGAIADIVEAMHAAVTWPPSLTSPSKDGRAGGIAGLAYETVRRAAKIVGGGVDLAMTPLASLIGERSSTPERDAMVSVLNGVVGDHLAETRNPLAIPMQLRRRGRALELRREALVATLPRITPRIVVLIHGLCGTDAQWKGGPVDYGAALEHELGYTPLYLRYNSGRHISTNGRALSQLLESLVEEWPVEVEELFLLGHSMGGLVARSALYYGTVEDEKWVAHVRRAAFLGSPHHGAPLERGGNWFEEIVGSIPYAAPLSRLGRLRSAGITDLRHGSVLDDDWRDGDRFARGADKRQPAPLPPGIDCLLVAATTGAREGDVRDLLVGDGLVPVASALGQHGDPLRALAIEPTRRRVVYRLHHMGLLRNEQVWGHLSEWIEAGREHEPTPASSASNPAIRVTDS
jgi:pimeloyl-ACP methyl ester carboxylesterase